MVHSNPDAFGSVVDALAGNFEVVEATVPEDDAAPTGLVDSDLYILDFEKLLLTSFTVKV